MVTTTNSWSDAVYQTPGGLPDENGWDGADNLMTLGEAIGQLRYEKGGTLNFACGHFPTPASGTLDVPVTVTGTADNVFLGLSAPGNKLSGLTLRGNVTAAGDNASASSVTLLDNAAIEFHSDSGTVTSIGGMGSITLYGANTTINNVDLSSGRVQAQGDNASVTNVHMADGSVTITGSQCTTNGVILDHGTLSVYGDSGKISDCQMSGDSGATVATAYVSGNNNSIDSLTLQNVTLGIVGDNNAFLDSIVTLTGGTFGGINVEGSNNQIVGLQVTSQDPPDINHAGYVGVTGPGDATDPNIISDSRFENTDVGLGGNGTQLLNSVVEHGQVVVSGYQTSHVVIQGNVIHAWPRSAYVTRALEVRGEYTTIGGADSGEGNVIAGNANSPAISLEDGSHDSEVVGNFIGTTDQGMTASGGGIGIEIDVRAGTVSNISIRRNLISGNDAGPGVTGMGIRITSGTGYEILGNTIGLDANGNAMPNDIGIDLGRNVQATIGNGNMADANVISANTMDGITTAFGTKADIAGNYIGTDRTGTQARRNGWGISVGSSSQAGDTSNVTIRRNVISGNGIGVGVIAGTVRQIEGNTIGLDANDNPLPNDYGVWLQGTSSDNLVGATVGGSDPAAGNVISGNRKAGIVIQSYSKNNRIEGNWIGTDRSGAQARGNGTGIIVRTDSNTIGSSGAGNVIAGNLENGLEIVGNENKVQANFIGTNSAGDNLGNGWNGVSISGSKNVIGSALGYDDKTLANSIAFSGQQDAARGNGVLVDGSASNRNCIRINSIFKNKRLGIDLGNDYFDRYRPELVAAKEDELEGANNHTWHPTIIDVNSNTQTISWMLNAPSENGPYAIDVYSDPENGRSQYAEGAVWKESQVLTDLIHGHYEFTTAIGASKITATATDKWGNTSEFSLADEDGDALCDTWEWNQSIDLHGDGDRDVALPDAHLLLKDVYVEVDSMAGWGPVAGVLESVQAVFAAHGIALHTTTEPADSAITPASGFAVPPFVAFGQVKRQHFAGGGGPGSDRYQAALLAYHYCVFAVTHDDNPGSSGLGEVLGNDFMVTLGRNWFWDDQGNYIATAAAASSHLDPTGPNADVIHCGPRYVREIQSGTFIHELGHNLGLSAGHTGTINWDRSTPRSTPQGGPRVAEFDPNYRSVMNYRYQGGGAGFEPPAFPGTWISDPQILNYSEAGPDEWHNLWFAFQEHSQILGAGDISDEPISENNSLPTRDSTVDLGTVFFANLSAQPSASYVLKTSRAGYLTVEAANSGPNLTLSNAGSVVVATGRLVDGRMRIDYQAPAAGGTYYLRVTGSGPVNLRLANLVTRTGTALAVGGTGEEDNFVFNASNGRKITVNGLAYQFTAAQVSAVTFDGGAGEDSIVLTGTTGNDTAKVWPDHGTLAGIGYRVTWTSVNGATVNAGGGKGTDAVYFYDKNSTIPDILTAAPGIATMAGDQYTNKAVGFLSLYAYSGSGGKDEARLSGKLGVKDTFASQAIAAGPGNAGQITGTMTGYVGSTRKYLMSFAKFNKVTADGKGDATDSASIKDSALNDLLSAGPHWIRLGGLSARDLSYFLQVSNFRKVTANSPGTADHDKKSTTQFRDQLLATGSWK